METLILAGIGLTALGYVVRIARRSMSGTHKCNCGGTCSGRSPSCGSLKKN
ncbi:MAG: hypothetical protein P4N59_21265 [Negativicutes bacterium]|nr:hypothetical protein [Negativicutes bacterium]